ncbi:RNA polymerase sigma-70 factor [Carboxylicivirga caseinilyticus]|uniref:RNA polymerase sigma-70 factor n=1 Tax=Carboxylicivirga caseinilyticus TaxID=3417572 RepID=UPI003D352AF0|nr:RNA polymerase sigma-70 factor [Marinilabiliaceae bacterium A049]
MTQTPKHINFNFNNLDNINDWFDVLFKEYYQSLCRFALTIVPYENLAEEAVQNVFVYLWEKRKTLLIKTNVKGLLYQSVYNESIRLRKRRLQNKNYEAEYLQQLLPEFENSDQPDLDFIKTAISNAIINLPEKCRDIFIMRRKEGLTNEEIANYLGISVKTVESQMTIALKKLRTELTPIIKHLPAILILLEIS